MRRSPLHIANTHTTCCLHCVGTVFPSSFCNTVYKYAKPAANASRLITTPAMLAGIAAAGAPAVAGAGAGASIAMALCMLNEISKKATMIMEDTAKLLEAIAARE